VVGNPGTKGASKPDQMKVSRKVRGEKVGPKGHNGFHRHVTHEKKKELIGKCEFLAGGAP